MDYDEAYANAPYIDGAEAYPARWAEAAAQWAAHLRSQGRADAGLSYGPSGRQCLDLFRPEGPAAGLVIFVHGGYWLKFDRSFWSHLSQGALTRGWAVAMPSYDLCPRVRIFEITRQIAAAVTCASRIVAGPVILTGHSAGGHLVSRMLAPGLLSPEIAARLRRVMPISPVADLRPLLRTAMQAELCLDRAEAEAESPVLMTNRHDVPVTVWVGGEERPAFLDQARWLAEAWGADHVIDPGKHHFNVIDGLAEAHGAMLYALLS